MASWKAPGSILEAPGLDFKASRPWFWTIGPHFFTIFEQNAKKGLAFADIGYVLVSGETAIANKGNKLLANPDVGRLFLGG